MKEKLLLKDQLFNSNKVEKIATEIYRVSPSFDKLSFKREVLSKFPLLELKARISWIAECLRHYLPADFKQAVTILLGSLPAPNNPDLSDSDFGDFIYAPYGEYVAKYGCSEETLQLSLNALLEITQRFSAEDAVRYFINAFPKQTLKELLGWAKDPNYHVRRLCSECTRPKLPWSQKIKISVAAPLHILEQLFFDRTRYVTRSVANHMNDISKIDPNLTLRTLKKWRALGKQNPKEMEYIMRHSLRTLVKRGDLNALKMLGYNVTAKIRLSNLHLTKEVKMGKALEFSFTVKSAISSNAIVNYALFFRNKNGELNSSKIFTLKNLKLGKDEVVHVSKRHILRPNMTTRTLYPGKHMIEIRINGKKGARREFSIR